MSHPVPIQFQPVDAEALANATGRIALVVDEGGKLGQAGRKLDKLTRGALARYLGSEAFAALKSGDAADLGWPAGLAAEALQVVKLDRKADANTARKAGGAIGRGLSKAGTLVVAEGGKMAAELSLGLALRAYGFSAHKTGEQPQPGPVTLMVTEPEKVAAEAAPMAALAEGVFFTRDLVNEPANILTTDDFAARLAAMHELGL